MSSTAGVRVRATRDRPLFQGEYRATRAWRIYDPDGYPLPGVYVVDHRWGMTIIRNGRMVTTWHGGIGPGDLARLKYAALAAGED